MNGFLLALLIAVWLIAIIGSGYLAADRWSWVWLLVVVALFVIPLGLMLKSAFSEEESGPCLRTETGWAYNAATKTTMPYTYCAERGTWVK